jgi:hypothetical protein
MEERRLGRIEVEGLSMFSLSLLALIVLSTSLSACVQHAATVIKPVIPTTEAGCIAQGGSWTSLGIPMEGAPKMCDLKTTDAGVRCRDSRECEGSCVAPSRAAVGVRTSGACSAYLSDFGNVRQIHDGVVEEINVQ